MARGHWAVPPKLYLVRKADSTDNKFKASRQPNEQFFWLDCIGEIVVKRQITKKIASS